MIQKNTKRTREVISQAKFTQDELYYIPL